LLNKMLEQFLRQSKLFRISLLFIIIIVGFFMRSYMLDFPSIGYHNMKENEYLSMAEVMLNSKDFLTRRVYFYFGLEDDTRMRYFPQIPLVSYQIILAWKILGNSMWAARLTNVLFGTASIAIMYGLAFLLFDNVTFSLTSAFTLSIMPLAVFFSRNLQPESPGLFFILLGTYFYLRWIKFPLFRNFFLGGLSFSLACVYKYSFIFAALPILACIPYRRLWNEKKRLLQYLLIFAISYSVLLFSFLYLKNLGQWGFDQKFTLGRINVFELFTFGYWKSFGPEIFPYIYDENYGYLFTALCVIGTLCACIRCKKIIDRYLAGSVIAIILYCMIFSDFINQHNYYQMPFLAMVCISSTYALVWIADLLKKIFKADRFVWLAVVVIIVAPSTVFKSIVRMYKTVYLGEDVAGQTLQKLLAPNERFFLLTAIGRYAQRFCGWPTSFENFIETENKFKIRYICVYPVSKFKKIAKSAGFYNYITNNYHPKELGFIKIARKSKLAYIILERGYRSDFANGFLNLQNVKPQFKKAYHLFGRRIESYALSLN
jgi:4-amino-4-deoxy-L-arabinose transferase-like glycosyltransferase